MRDFRAVRSRAPLRISFAGGGTDLAPFSTDEGGAVLSSAISLYAFASLREMDGDGTRVLSLDFGMDIHVRDQGHLPFDGRIDLAKAALQFFGVPNGLEITLHAQAPPGSGLGASSALMVALTAALLEWTQQQTDPYKTAEIAAHIERDILKVPGGLQDHYASSFGGVNFMEFGKDVFVHSLRLPADVRLELESQMLLCYTGTSRYSGTVISDQQSRVERGDSESLESLHSLKQMAVEMKNLFLRGRIDAMGFLLNEGWNSKKTLSPMISNVRIDDLHASIMESGALGAKLCGAGAGGYMLALVPIENKVRLAKNLGELGVQVKEVSLCETGVEVWKARR